MDFYPPPSASSCHPRNCFLPPSLPREPGRLLLSSLLSPRPHHRSPQTTTTTAARSTSSFYQLSSIPLTRPALSTYTNPRFAPGPKPRARPTPLPGTTFLPRPPHLILSSPPFIPNLLPRAVHPFFRPQPANFGNRPRIPPASRSTATERPPPICGFAYNRL